IGAARTANERCSRLYRSLRTSEIDDEAGKFRGLVLRYEGIGVLDRYQRCAGERAARAPRAIPVASRTCGEVWGEPGFPPHGCHRVTSPTTWPSGSAKSAKVTPPGTCVGGWTVLPPNRSTWSSAAFGSSTPT